MSNKDFKARLIGASWILHNTNLLTQNDSFRIFYSFDFNKNFLFFELSEDFILQQQKYLIKLDLNSQCLLKSPYAIKL